VAAVCGFVAAMHYVVRPWLRRSLASLPKGSPQAPSWDRLGLVLLAVFLSAMITSLLGVFAILGAFVCGTILSEEEELRQELRQQLRPLVMIVFVPIFFTYTGLQTDLGSLESWPEWLWFGGILLVAIAGKWAGCGVAAWLGGFPKREAACIGVLMNARGLMELVVINVGRDVGVIVPSVYCMLVLMALITTLMATPLVIRLMPGTELESPIRASGFMSGGRFVRDAAAHPLEQES
jgi:Kef-type K+ transport system membrane component KefB